MESRIEIPGPGATVVCVRQALQSITNNKLPAAYESLSTLEFSGETLALQLNGSEETLKPSQERRIPVSSLVREGRILAESDPMTWMPHNEIKVSRTIFIPYCDTSQVRTSLRFNLSNNNRERRLATLRWELVLPPAHAFSYDSESGKATASAPGDIPREQRQHSSLGFSFDSRQFDAIDNRLLLLNFSSLRPHRVNLKEIEEHAQVVTAFFTANLRPGEAVEAIVTFDFFVLLRQQVSSTVFLAVRQDTKGKPAWQGAMAAATAWIDRLETCRNSALTAPGFRRFAPFLWFERDKPLPDPVLRFIHNMPCLERIIVFGEVLQHDLENLLTALLDKGGDRQLRLHIFTDNEYYRDRVNVLRGNIQARMIIADEPTQRVKRMEEIVSISVVPDPNLLPLALRHFMEQVSLTDFFACQVQDTNVFLVPSSMRYARLVTAACIPLARQLGAPLLLWSDKTRGEILKFLETHNTRRLFLVGSYREEEKQAICESAKGSKCAVAITNVPYRHPVRASAALARLFKAHYLLDWLVQALRAESQQIKNNQTGRQLKQLTHDYLNLIRRSSWAKRNLSGALEDVMNGGDPQDLLPVYHDIFIGRDEFIRSFKKHFTQAALDDDLLGPLAPVWNDAVVLCDFTVAGEHIFSAASFASYHSAPLLLFPAIHERKEAFLEQRVKDFEEQYFSLQPQRSAADQEGMLEQIDNESEKAKENSYKDLLHRFKKTENLARLIFPSDIQTTLETLNPLSLALYNSDVQVPYETIPSRQGPLSLKFAMSRLAGTDAFETSIITSSGTLFANELQRQECFNILLCMANIKSLANLDLDREFELIEKALQHSSKPIHLDALRDLESFTKEAVLDHLAGNIHLFHFSGHGQENQDQPQRSGIMLWNTETQSHQSLTALEVKYRTKLGAHPVVFLNTCFGSRNSRIQVGDPEVDNPADTDPSLEEQEHSMTAQTARQMMGVSSSFIHSGAAAVMAPLWEMYDQIAIEYAHFWYTYIAQGCSISEAALLAKIDTIIKMMTPAESEEHSASGSAYGYRALSYVIYGDPTLRLYPLSHLVENHSDTARRLLRLNLSST